MCINTEKATASYYGDYRRGGLLGKKCSVKILIFQSYIQVEAFEFYDSKIGMNSEVYDIPFLNIKQIYRSESIKEENIIIMYSKESVVREAQGQIVLLGLDNFDKWFEILNDAKKLFDENIMKMEELELEREEREKQLHMEAERKADHFYQECYSYHIKESTPVYHFFREKNRTALVYIDAQKSLNFLKIDGYNEDEHNGVITYQNIHYYEKAGDVHYATQIKGEYSSYGGSMTGGKFSKLATVGGGLLFGVLGMGIGAALTYKPPSIEPTNTHFNLDSDIKKIDERSIMLNFYSDIKKQFIDIELPQDIYNYLQTYLPEKKYSTVDELERKSVVHQSMDLIKSGELLKVSEVSRGELPSDGLETDSISEFKKKVEKLKIMKEAELLSEAEFEIQKNELLKSI